MKFSSDVHSFAFLALTLFGPSFSAALSVDPSAQLEAASLASRLDAYSASLKKSKTECSSKGTGTVTLAAAANTGVSAYGTASATGGLGYPGNNASSLASTLPYARTSKKKGKCKHTGTKYMRTTKIVTSYTTTCPVTSTITSGGTEIVQIDMTTSTVTSTITTTVGSQPTGSANDNSPAQNSPGQSGSGQDNGSGSASGTNSQQPANGSDNNNSPAAANDSGSLSAGGNNNNSGSQHPTGSSNNNYPAGAGASVCAPQSTVTIMTQYTVTVTAAASAADLNGALPNSAIPNSYASMDSPVAPSSTSSRTVKTKCRSGVSTGFIPSGTGAYGGVQNGTYAAGTGLPLKKARRSRL